jgi:DNA polymerase-3 subunit epsilon
MQVLHDLTNDLGFLDVTQKLRRQPDGKIIFTFGKYQGQSVHEVFVKERNYYHWMMEREFSSQVKQIIKGILKEVDGKKG